jgi:hypothetical protein
VKNLPRAVALMIINGHVTDDLECFTDDSTCLLQNPLLKDLAFVEVDMADCCEEGCYLYFNTKNSCWVRSGKAVGRNFTEHHKEHAQKAILEDAADLSSRFYHTYLSKETKCKDMATRRGYFENLQLYSGLGFD